MTGRPSAPSTAARKSNPHHSGWAKLVAPRLEMTPSALAGPGVSSPTATTLLRATPVREIAAVNTSRIASIAAAGPSVTRLGTSSIPPTRNTPPSTSTVALVFVPPTSRPTTACAAWSDIAPSVRGADGPGAETRTGRGTLRHPAP